MNDLTLYIGNKNYSSWSLRAWLVLKQTETAFKEVVIPLNQRDTQERILAYSPSGRVPMLKLGDLKIWESIAIAEYLAAAFPEARLWPEDPSARAIARAVSAEMHSGFEALRTHMPMDMRGRHPGKGRTPEVEQDIKRIINIWTECREHFSKGGDFLFGEFCIADAMYAPVTSRFTTYGVEVTGVAAAYRDAIWAWPAFQEWLKEAEQEPWVINYDIH